MPSAEHRKLTELEGSALAIIARNGACTAYAIKETFRKSPSSFWSGSAGAVYPLVKRLEARGLITSQADENDGRARREFTITTEGEAVLADWLTDVERAANPGYDPLRTRLFFAELMPEGVLDGFLTEVDAKMRANGTPPDMELRHVPSVHWIWRRFRHGALAAFSNWLKDNQAEQRPDAAGPAARPAARQ